ncbi:L,D-transpeptidase ErfK/SrfK [Marinobacter persicus]|jgi:L,D-transpeptidase ErfK/SrfK|uniref:L,D-transpeptidase ErfK/SrfK n=1 Tax=Marinobacter persicus TaxID=930118 RepID=A0A2S6GAB0_9GAMM|nr:L,D-transpeptidase ErfK/SrfK [Marinobacter persicus]PPK56221.1 L,D-transpeptidase ErfK/SrfK [Marinobacter persicus]PPK59816.1 L,D-transpeptidase ErfK/SrfK [Marinobacter persicus]
MRLKCGFALCLSLLWAAPVALSAQESASQAQGGSEVEASEQRAPRVPTFQARGDLAGELQMFTTEYEDTFAGIGTDLALGYLELVHANPGVDPWLPGEGTTITLPRMYVLPDTRREGIVINLAEYRLYYFSEQGVQVYPVGVGTEENPSPLTNAEVTMPLESPAWYPPASIRAEYEASGDFLPRMIPPGPGNPLGTHALLLSEKGYLIHGTNKRFGVGMPVSHGCFRMYNEDISRFVYQVEKGTPVQVIREPVKVGISQGEVWLEIHRPGEDYPPEDREKVWQQVLAKLEEFRARHPETQLKRRAIDIAVDQADGIPMMIGETLPRMASDDAPERQSRGEESRSDQTLYF